VLVCLASEPRQAFVIRDAQRLGVRCIVTGTPHRQLGLPTISEDNRQAMRLAAEHLLKLGHRKIALILERVAEPWVFERHETFLQVLQEAGVEPDERLVHWTPQNDPREGNPASQEALAAFLERMRPTAVIPGSYLPMLYIDRLSRDRRLVIPEQLSVISMEQDIPKAHWLGGMDLSHVRFPMREIGRKVAELARSLVQQESVPDQLVLPARLVPGKSTRQLAGASEGAR
jgi:LacI family transcriptional regulator